MHIILTLNWPRRCGPSTGNLFTQIAIDDNDVTDHTFIIIIIKALQCNNTEKVMVYIHS